MKIFLASFFLIFSVSVIPFTLADEEPYVLSHFSAKGVITENNPFGGAVFWTIVDGEDGTIVTSSINGLTVIRMHMTQSDSCEELSNTVCLDASITSTKNTLFTEEGVTAKIIFEMPDRQKISILSGELATLDLELNLEKIRVKEVAKIVEEEVQEEVQEESNELQREAWSKLQDALELTKNSQIQQVLSESNSEFANLDDPYDLIDQRDAEWTSTPEDEMTPLMGTLLGSKVSEFLREIMITDQQKPTDFVYEEIFLTNSFGANVAQTGKTSDYKQWDEQWWILAKRNGVEFESGFDESAGVESLSMSVRIADDSGRFMGVMKFVINAEQAS